MPSSPSKAVGLCRLVWVEYSHGDAKLKGYLAYDDSATGKRPAILMIHDRAGMQPYTLKHAETLC